MTGQEECNEFVTQFLVRQRRAIFVHGADEHRQDVVPVGGTIGARSCDAAVEKGVDGCPLAQKSSPGREGPEDPSGAAGP